MQDSVFTKIIKGEIPCYKIYEDINTMAFLDIHPRQSGQIVVVPKVQVPFVWDLSVEDYQSLMQTVQKVGRKLREAFPHKNRVGVMIEGLDVANHAHVVVLPFDDAQEYHGPSKEVSQEELADMAEKLRII